MKQHKNIALALAGAAACLTGISTDVAAETASKEDIGQWDIKTALLFYSETDRVQVVEPVISATKQIDTDETLTLKLVLDTLTGASASGAVPSNTPQTYTRPSGWGSYTVPAGETPLDDTFKDTRIAISASWAKPVSRLTKITFGGNASLEYDYTSLSANALVARDFNNRNTTLSGSISLGFDEVNPVGRAPIAFGEMQPAGLRQEKGASVEDKTIIDAVFGVTQVLDKNSLLVLNYSLGQSDGYLTDPYKVISVVDTVTANPTSTIYENRPDSRLRHAIYSQYKRNFSGSILDVSYRFSKDDFGIDSNTIDFRYKYRMGNSGAFVMPHLRYYSQTAADFYVPFYVEGQQAVAGDTSSFATADYRMGEFVATTIGLEYGRDNGSRPWSVALEYYLQSGDEPAGKFGQLIDQEIYPDVEAVMLRINFDY